MGDVEREAGRLNVDAGNGAGVLAGVLHPGPQQVQAQLQRPVLAVLVLDPATTSTPLVIKQSKMAKAIFLIRGYD